MSLREKYGYAYNIESMYQPYSDTGLFNIYFGTDKENLEKSLVVIHKELNLLREKKLGTLQLHKAKRQFMGQLAIAAESNESLMLSVAKSFLVYNTADNLQEVYAQIENVSAMELMDISNEILDINNLSYLIYK